MRIKMFLLSKKNICILALLIFIILSTITIITVNKCNKNENTSPISKDSLTNEDNFILTINELSIRVPVIPEVESDDKDRYNEALQHGVVHMVGTALPGTNEGNIFIYGHSSAKDNPKYGKIFSDLDRLKFGDLVKLEYNGGEYEYIVEKKKFIEKYDLSVLEQSQQEQLTLMTCWPVGTDDRRLVVIAKRK